MSVRSCHCTVCISKPLVFSVSSPWAASEILHPFCSHFGCVCFAAKPIHWLFSSCHNSSFSYTCPSLAFSRLWTHNRHTYWYFRLILTSAVIITQLSFMFTFTFICCNLDSFCVLWFLVLTSYFRELYLWELFEVWVKSETKENLEWILAQLFVGINNSRHLFGTFLDHLGGVSSEGNAAGSWMLATKAQGDVFRLLSWGCPGPLGWFSQQSVGCTWSSLCTESLTSRAAVSFHTPTSGRWRADLAFVSWWLLILGGLLNRRPSSLDLVNIKCLERQSWIWSFLMKTYSLVSVLLNKMGVWCIWKESFYFFLAFFNCFQLIRVPWVPPYLCCSEN